jgi:hypothetical protein
VGRPRPLEHRDAAGRFCSGQPPFGLEWLLCGPDLTLDFVRWLARDGQKLQSTSGSFGAPRRLEFRQRVTAADGDRNCGHRDIVRRFPEVVPVTLQHCSFAHRRSSSWFADQQELFSCIREHD